MMASGLAFLGMALSEGWQQLNGIIFKNGADADTAWQNKQASGLSAEQVGQRAIDAQNGDRCREEWEAATKACIEQINRPNPDKNITGGYKTVEECARGLVTEFCKGNKVDWGLKGPPPGWRPQ